MTPDFFHYLLGGGLLSLLVGLMTLNSKIRKTAAEAQSLELSNSEKATEILIENIVEPLKKELDETRQEFSSTKVEMERLRKAINAANACHYSNGCPVLHSLRHKERHPPDE